MNIAVIRAKEFMVVLALSMIGGAANAYGVVTGTVEYLQVGRASNGYMLVKVYETPANPAACATDPRFAVDPGTDVGKAQIAFLLAAQAANRRIYIRGTGDCDIYDGYESISYMRLLD